MMRMANTYSPPTRASRFSIPFTLVGLLAGFVAGHSLAATLEPQEFESTEGYYQLTWDAEEAVRLVESTEQDFSSARIVYVGNDSGHVASGKPNGVWYYRLESEDGATVLSETSTIVVRHHSLGRAAAFFALGGVVFLATLALIFIPRDGSNERV
jgi:hypothetical protein